MCFLEYQSLWLVQKMSLICPSNPTLLWNIFCVGFESKSECLKNNGFWLAGDPRGETFSEIYVFLPESFRHDLYVRRKPKRNRRKFLCLDNPSSKLFRLGDHITRKDSDLSIMLTGKIVRSRNVKENACNNPEPFCGARILMLVISRVCNLQITNNRELRNWECKRRKSDI